MREEDNTMQLPLNITFRNMPPSAAIEAAIREKAAKLDHFYERIMACNVTVIAPHKHQHKGKIYQVHIDITVPNGEVVVSRDNHQNHAHEDAYVAIRDAFNAAKRQLEDFARRQRGEVKAHEPPPTGYIKAILPNQDFGYIASRDGRDIYFHRNSLIGADFDKLEEGLEVRFVEEPGEQGPQASTVHLVGKLHPL